MTAVPSRGFSGHGKEVGITEEFDKRSSASLLPDTVESMTTETPRAPKIKLAHLAPGYLGDIGPEEFLEGMGFSELDLTEVDSSQATYLDCSLSRANFGAAESPVNLTGARFS